MSAAGERIRLDEQIRRMRALLDGLTMSINLTAPLLESAEAVADAGIRLVAAAARHDAYQRSEAAQRPPVCEHCNDTHRMTLGDRAVMCTRCPRPCRDCAMDQGRGAYCSATPCRCECHRRSA